MEASILAQMITEERYLDVDCPLLYQNIVDRSLDGKEGDYVITTVLYGFRYSITFKAFYNQNVTSLNVKGYL